MYFYPYHFHNINFTCNYIRIKLNTLDKPSVSITLKNMRNHCYLEVKQLVTDFHANFQQFIESTDNWKPAKSNNADLSTTYHNSMCTGILLLIDFDLSWNLHELQDAM